MKKLIALLLALVMLFAVGCDSTEPSEDTTENITLSSGEEVPQTEMTEEAEPDNEVSFEELTVVDNEYCTIKITGIEPDNMWGYTLNTYLENKSADTTYMFSVDTAAINGVQTDTLFASEVAPGKKSNEGIIFTDTALEDNGVGDYTDIELSFRVYDSNDWMAEPVASTSIHVYPYGEEKATAFSREVKETDQIIVDNEYVTIIVTACQEDSLWGYTADLFLVNKTDVSVMFSVDEASVNGFMADPFYADSVEAGKCAFSTITWFSSTLEENGIVDVESIEFNIRAYDNTDWMAEDFANEAVTLNP